MAVNMNVKFCFTSTLEKFIALEDKNPLALYFITDEATGQNYLYKGSEMIAAGHEATAQFAGLMSAADKAKLDNIAETALAALTPLDGSINIVDDENGGKKIGVNVSATVGNLVAVKDDGLFVNVAIDNVDGLKEKLDAIEKSAEGGVHYKGSVATIDDLPTDAVQGDLYEVLEDNSEWCFNGEQWFEYGHTVDFSPIAGQGIEVDGRTVSVKIADNSHGLTAVDGAMTLVLATAEQDGAMSKEDKAFIDSISTNYATNDKLDEVVKDFNDALSWGEI